ncbi:MAG: CBS domain-containing protein [Candidatus Nanoarchaeia archaeon]|jgi:CBS domain-containing protein
MIVSEIMVTDVKIINGDAQVSKALSLMTREHVKELPVVNNGVVEGLITVHSIISHSGADIKINKLMFMPPALNENDDLLTALRLMKEAGVQGLPVISDTLLVGFISDYDIINALKSELKGFTVNDLMRQLPSSLKPSDNIAHAKQLMAQEKVTALPVISDYRLVGVLSEDDLLDFYKPAEKMGYGAGGEGNSVKTLNAIIKSVIPKNFESVRVGEKLTKAVDLMINHHLSMLFIVNDSDEPVGCLNRFELIRRLYDEHQPKDLMINLSGLELDSVTNALLIKVVNDHLARINYLAKSIKEISVYIKPLHAGEGVRKFELDLKIRLTTGVAHGVKKVGYALRELLDEALSDTEKLMKKNYKKSNP